MSNSVKKTPIVKNNGKSKKTKKKRANKSIRRKLKDSEVTMSDADYKKYYNSYDITDYKCRWTKEEALYEYHHPRNEWSNWKEHFATEEDFLNYWEKNMRRK